MTDPILREKYDSLGIVSDEIGTGFTRTDVEKFTIDLQKIDDMKDLFNLYLELQSGLLPPSPQGNISGRLLVGRAGPGRESSAVSQLSVEVDLPSSGRVIVLRYSLDDP